MALRTVEAAKTQDLVVWAGRPETQETPVLWFQPKDERV